MVDNQTDFISMIEENLAEAVVAVLFILAFLSAGLITSYFIQSLILKDSVIALSAVFGFIALLIKIYRGTTIE